MAVRLENIQTSSPAQKTPISASPSIRKPRRLENIAVQGPSTEDLLRSLGPTLPGQFPVQQLPPTRIPQFQGATGFGAGARGVVQRGREPAEQQRLQSIATIQELQNRGLSMRDIEERLDPTFAKQLKSDIGRTIGGLGGGLGGAKAGAAIGTAISPGAGTIVGGLAGAVAGAAAFGGAGEDIQNTIETVQIAKKAGRGERLTFNEKRLLQRTDADFRAEKLNASFGEGIAELGGRLTVGLVGKAFRRPFTSAILPEVKALQKPFAAVGGQFSPAQLVEGSAAKSKLTAFFADFVDTLESIGEQGFGGRGIFKKFRATKQVLPFEKLIKSTADDIVGTAARLTDDQKATLALDIVKGRSSAYKGVRNSLYRWARGANQGGDVLVDLTPLERALGNERSRIAGKIGRTDFGEALFTKLEDIIKVAKERPLGGDSPVINVIEAEDIIKGLNAEFRRLTGDTPGKRLVSIAKDILTRESKKASRGLEPEVVRRLGIAKKFVREGQPIFEESIFKGLVDPEKGIGKNAEFLNKILFPNKAPSQIARAKNLIIGTGKFETARTQRTWNNLTLGWLEDAIEGSISPSDGLFSVARFQGRLNRMGQSSLLEMFGPDTLKRINQIPEIGRILQKETAGGGNLAIRIAQVGAVGGLVAGDKGIRKTAAAVLMAPSALALLFTSDAGIKALTTGLKAKPGSKFAAVTGARVIGIVRRLQKEKEMAERRKKQPISQGSPLFRRGAGATAL